MKSSKSRTLLAAMMAAIGLAQTPAPSFGGTHGYHGRMKHRRNGRGKAGSYGRGLMNAWNRKRQQQQQKLNHLRDENGAYTLTGYDTSQALFGNDPSKVRRMWLAGISAQRGY